MEPLFQNNISSHVWNKDHTQCAIICDTTNDSSDIYIYYAQDAAYKKWKRLYALKAHTTRVTCIDWSHQTNLIVTCSNDRNVYIWTKQKLEWKPQPVLLRISCNVTCVKWSPNGSKCAVGTSSKQIAICYYDKLRNIWAAKIIKNASNSSILSINWSPNNIFIIAGSSDTKCRIYSTYIDAIDTQCKMNNYSAIFDKNSVLRFGAILTEFDEANGWIESCQFSPSGLRFAFTGHDSSIHFGSFGVDKINIQSIHRRELPLRCIAFLRNNVVVAGGYDCVPILYEYDNNKWIEKGSIDTGLKSQQLKAKTAKKKVSAFGSAFSKFNTTSAIGSAPPPSMGFSVGGAGDVNSFRESIKQKRIPRISSISYEGVFAEYYFDTTTNAQTSMNKNDDDDDNKDNNLLFYPSYCYGKCQRPKALQLFDKQNDNQTEYYMSIGLNSSLSKEYFKRPPLNLIIVLDVSGSMGSSFSAYGSIKKRKIELARDSIMYIVDQLDDNDRFGLVTFNHAATTHFKMDLIKNVDKNAIKEKIVKVVKASGGTNMQCGYQAALDMYDYNICMDHKYSNRIIFLTDMRPCCGVRDKHGIYCMIEDAEKDKNVFTTFIGVGIDIQIEYLQHMNDIKGFNYFYVDNSDDFMQKMNNEFEYIVNPMVFDLKVVLQSEGNQCCIEEVFGVPSSDKSTKNIMNNGEVITIKSLFPSPTDKKNRVKGGIIILKLRTDKSLLGNLQLKISYKDRYNQQFNSEQTVIFKDNFIDNDMIESDEDFGSYFDNNGIRKAVLLVHYVQFIHKWIGNRNEFNKSMDSYQSFFNYFKKSSQIVADDLLIQELNILEKIFTKEYFANSGYNSRLTHRNRSGRQYIEYETALPYRHQNLINHIDVYEDNKFTTSSVDGRLLHWDLTQKY